jgi:hypothetical protein
LSPLWSGVGPESFERKKPRREAEAKCLLYRLLCSRDDRIRTCDPLNPIQVRYRAAPHPVAEYQSADRLENVTPSPALNQCRPTTFLFLERADALTRTLAVASRCPPLLSPA